MKSEGCAMNEKPFVLQFIAQRSDFIVPAI
jgi:hypothetical protein